jgi:hypothetical protein
MPMNPIIRTRTRYFRHTFPPTRDNMYQLHTPAALTLGRTAHGTHWVEVSVNPRTTLELVVKRIIPASTRNLNPVIWTAAGHCTDWAVTIGISKWAGITGLLLTHIWKVLNSNLGWNTSYSHWGFSRFSSVPPSKRQGRTSIRPWMLPYKSFPNSSIIRPFHTIQSSYRQS